MPTSYSITDSFGSNLAQLLSDKILKVYPSFDSEHYISEIENESKNLNYTQRVVLHANQLQKHLPQNYVQAIEVLCSILGPKNPKETGMFTNYYWILPIGKFVETYGLDHYNISIQAIEEITQRNTGEYAIRPFLRLYPQKTIQQMQHWSLAASFHLRRLASEGCRPKLPWSSKLEEFINSPEPVFKY
ncbi:MAG: 3-methyladenine DNA glycosylase [Patescibacteria group bacterium]